MLNRSCHYWDYKVGDKVLLRKDGILRKSESQYECDPWTITSVHTNGTRVQHGTYSEQLNIRRVTHFLTTRLNSHNVIFIRLSPSYTKHLRFTKFMIIIMTLVCTMDKFFLPHEGFFSASTLTLHL